MSGAFAVFVVAAICWAAAAETALNLLGPMAWLYAFAGAASVWLAARRVRNWMRWPCLSAVFALYFGIGFVESGTWFPGIAPVLLLVLNVLPRTTQEVDWFGPFLMQWSILLACIVGSESFWFHVGIKKPRRGGA